MEKKKFMLSESNASTGMLQHGLNDRFHLHAERFVRFSIHPPIVVQAQAIFKSTLNIIYI